MPAAGLPDRSRPLAPGQDTAPPAAGWGVVIKKPSVIEQLAHGLPAAVEEYRRVLLDGVLAWHAGQRWVPVVAAQYLVGALSRLDHLDALTDVPAEQVEGHAVVTDHGFAHRPDRGVDAGQQAGAV